MHNLLKNSPRITARIAIASFLLCFALQSVTDAQELIPVPRGATQYPTAQVSQSGRQDFVVRIGSVTTVAGIRSNKLTGFGLVTGLNGTGGKTPSTREFALRFLESLGSRADSGVRQSIRNDTQVRTDNLSMVSVTAELPAFRTAGTTIDVTVSAFDNATSLQGGVLQIAPLKGFDGEVYAVAGGNISIGGHSSGGQAASVTVNHPTVGIIANGATVEKEVCDEQFARNGTVDLVLKEQSFENVRRISDAINRLMPNTAVAADPATVRLSVPHEIPRGDLSTYHQYVMRFVADAQRAVFVPDIPARVVIDERTGTVVFGENVRISRVIFSHANLSVVTGESPGISQPAPFSQGQTAVVPRTELQVNEASDVFRVLDEPVTVAELARALNALGATPRDLIAILLSLKAAGALHAELISR